MLDDRLAKLELSLNSVKAVTDSFAASTSEGVSLPNSVLDENRALRSRIAHLEGNHNKLIQEKLVNNLIITGISKRLEPSVAFWKLVELLAVNISKQDVIQIELLRAKTTTAKRLRFATSTILVKFATFAPKLLLIKRKREIGVAFSQQLGELLPDQSTSSSNSVIYFRDHLSSFGHRLFNRAKQAKAIVGFKFVWTRNTEILMCKDKEAKVFHILNDADLDNLIAAHKVPVPLPDTNTEGGAPVNTTITSPIDPTVEELDISKRVPNSVVASPPHNRSFISPEALSLSLEQAKAAATLTGTIDSPSGEKPDKVDSSINIPIDANFADTSLDNQENK